MKEFTCSSNSCIYKAFRREPSYDHNVSLSTDFRGSLPQLHRRRRQKYTERLTRLRRPNNISNQFESNRTWIIHETQLHALSNQIVRHPFFSVSIRQVVTMWPISLFCFLFPFSSFFFISLILFYFMFFFISLLLIVFLRYIISISLISISYNWI